MVVSKQRLGCLRVAAQACEGKRGWERPEPARSSHKLHAVKRRDMCTRQAQRRVSRRAALEDEVCARLPGPEVCCSDADVGESVCD